MKTLLATMTAVALGTAGFAAENLDKSVREAPRALSATELAVGRLVPNLSLKPLSGKMFRLSDQKAPATVIAFYGASCPISKRYGPTLAAYERRFLPQGVQFIYVDPLESDTREQIETAIRTHGLKGAFIHDVNREVRNALGARSTTEVFVLDAARTLIYRGAVDDQYGLAYSLEAPKTRLLAEALEATLAGKRPKVQATTAPGCALEVAAARQNSAVDFHGRVSRIVQQHCQECHHTGGIAPFPLVTFNDVSSHAGMIRKMVEKDLMPPWFAAPTPTGHVSPWANDRTLPAEDKRDLLAWIASGKQEGNPADAPVPLKFSKEWQIGEPDVVLQIPKPITVKATGKMPYQNVFVETSFAEDRWVRSFEVRPTAREVVHHVLVFVIPKDPNAPTNSSGRPKRARTDEGGNFFAAYVPGNSAQQFESGFAKLLPAGATLQFQIHYTPSGTEAQDQTRLGLIFAKEFPKHEVRVAGVVNPLLRIPPGAENHPVHATLLVMFNAKVMSFMPHMHLRGKAFRYELELPGGKKQTLLEVPRYDFNWQLQYRLSEPIDAPLGSKILATGWYDNSANNPANPDPAREVRWGPQTDDEMMLGYVEYYVPALKPGEKASALNLATRDGALLFTILDKNGDGRITRDEAPTPESFKLADKDNDGIVTREEIKALVNKPKR